MDRIYHNAFCYALFSMDVVNSWTKVVIVVVSTVSESNNNNRFYRFLWEEIY